MAVAGREADDQLGEVLRQAVGIGGIVGQQHLGDSGDLGGFLGDGAAILPGHQQMDVAADLLRRRHHMQGGGLQRGIVMFNENEGGHGSGIPISEWRVMDKGSDDLGFVAQLVHQLRHRLHLHAGLALRRLHHRIRRRGARR